MNRKKLILAVLAAGLVIAVITSYFRMPRQKSVDKLKFTTGSVAVPRQTTKPATGLETTEARIRFDLLDSLSQRFSGYRRNLFKPVFREEQKVIPLPPPPPPARQSASAQVKQPVVPPPEQMQMPATTPVQRDMANFTFLGFLKKGNQKTIFLSSNKEIFLARKGDKLAGKYEVSNITDDVLTITSLSEGGEIVIPLVENKPLAAPGRSK
jgi:hypothetical protein